MHSRHNESRKLLQWKRPDTKSTLHDCIYMMVEKSEKKTYMLFEVRIFYYSWVGVNNWRGHSEGFGVLVKFCSLSWVLVTQVCSLCEFSLHFLIYFYHVLVAPFSFCLFSFNLLFNGKKIALQCCAGFCLTTRQISHISYLPLEPPFYMHLILQ